MNALDLLMYELDTIIIIKRLIQYKKTISSNTLLVLDKKEYADIMVDAWFNYKKTISY